MISPFVQVGLSFPTKQTFMDLTHFHSSITKDKISRNPNLFFSYFIFQCFFSVFFLLDTIAFSVCYLNIDFYYVFHWFHIWSYVQSLTCWCTSAFNHSLFFEWEGLKTTLYCILKNHEGGNWRWYLQFEGIGVLCSIIKKPSTLNKQISHLKFY